MKTRHGALFFACSNRSRTREAPTPTNISTNSEPEIEKNGTPASPATALASSVFPLPGGPTSSTPRGIFAPRAWNFFGCLRNSMISWSSSLASSTPATSSKVTFGRFSVCSRARLFPKDIAWLLPDWACRSMSSHRPISRKNGSIVERRFGHRALRFLGSTLIVTPRSRSTLRYEVSLGGTKVRNAWPSRSLPLTVSSPMVTSTMRPAWAWVRNWLYEISSRGVFERYSGRKK